MFVPLFQTLNICLLSLKTPFKKPEKDNNCKQ